MKNKKLERELFFINGMATVLLNQAKDIVIQFDKLQQYPIEDIEKSKYKINEIAKKLMKLQKYYIEFDDYDKKLEICVSYYSQSNNVYFTSREIAEKAIEEFKDDLIKLYTWKFDFQRNVKKLKQWHRH